MKRSTENDGEEAKRSRGDTAGLTVTSVNHLPEVNGPRQRTDDYESKDDALILRRGDQFYLDILHGGFEEENHRFYLEVKTGRRPKKRNGTLVEIEKREQAKDEWSFQIVSKSEDSIRVCVWIPANTMVSCYTLTVISLHEQDGKREKVEFEFPKPVYILFNPWCEDDEVYMADEYLKNEYILNDTGIIYWGGQRAKPWNFGQFTDSALQCTFKLLETTIASRRDTAREVARHMSSQCNSCDSNGLLAGNWSGDYSGGVKPWQWTGSAAIFKKYLSSGTSVEYGQCWVFSGLTTSMMRCLGIPARSVTNYESAHDTDNNCTFDKYYDEELNYLEEDSDDSCWNFHVWNDVWMTRPDLPAGMGGWQAIDGTPQEESRGVYRCGPTSLQALKEGNVNYGYDGKFVFAEVNADTVYWKRTTDDPKRDWEAVRVKGNSIGTALLTKKPNMREGEDVMDQYKYRDGTLLEQAAVRNALKIAKNPIVELKRVEVKFSTKVPWNISADTGVNVKINAENKTSNVFTVNSAVAAHIIRYNGVKIKELKQKRVLETINALGDASMEFHYDAREYLDHLDENISIRLSIMAKVRENNQIYVTQKTCTVHKPELEMELVGNEGGSVKSQDSIQVKISVPSILGLDKYTKCSLEIDCPLIDHINMELDDTLADGSVVIEKTFKIKKVQKKRASELTASFNSMQISGIHGSLAFNVVPS